METTMLTWKNLGRVMTLGLAAFGGYALYEKSNFQLRRGDQFAGQRAMGSIEEARAWELAGQPVQTRMG